MSRKAKRKYQAIQTMEDGIRGYCFLNAVLDDISDDFHPHAKIAKFICKATLNEMIYLYLEKNSEEQLTKFMDRLNKETADVRTDSQLPAVPD